MVKGFRQNATCSCGSGRKYYECCLPSEPDAYARVTRYLEDYELQAKTARVKQCIHPDKSQCSDKIRRCHAIQNNRILTKLAVDGRVITLDNHSAYIFQAADLKGRRVATTFTGFCSYHDKILFQDIEDKPFRATPRQSFLYSYRTLAWHHHKKLEQINHILLQRKLAEKHSLPGVAEPKNPFDQAMLAFKVGRLENERRLSLFNECLIKENYGELSSYIWEIPYELQIAVCAMLEIEYDIDGERINDLMSSEPLKSVYLNIFPGDGVSYCLWSWHEKDTVYESFTKG